MVNYTLFSNDPEMIERFGKYSKITGVIFLIIGLVGIFWPVLMSVTTAIFVGWLFVFSGIMIGWHTWKTNPKDWLGWFKTVIFFLTGLFIVIHPFPGIAALGLLFAIYFLLDTFASTALAFTMRPEKHWWIALLNGILSLAIAIFFLIGWPFSSLWLVGLLVGISLFFDGILLLSLSGAAKESK